MKSHCTRTFLLVTVGAMAMTSASAQIIDDDFEVDTSANYTIANDGTPNGFYGHPPYCIPWVPAWKTWPWAG